MWAVVSTMGVDFAGNPGGKGTGHGGPASGKPTRRTRLNETQKNTSRR